MIAVWAGGAESFLADKMLAPTRENIFFIVVLCLLPVLLVTLGLILVQKRRKQKAEAEAALAEARARAALNQAMAASNKTQEEEEKESRFFMLSQTDERMKNREKIEYDKIRSLKELCERFRNFAANRLGLFYIGACGIAYSCYAGYVGYGKNVACVCIRGILTK